jgi:hypothetical protein
MNWFRPSDMMPMPNGHVWVTCESIKDGSKSVVIGVWADNHWLGTVGNVLAWAEMEKPDPYNGVRPFRVDWLPYLGDDDGDCTMGTPDDSGP